MDWENDEIFFCLLDLCESPTATPEAIEDFLRLGVDPELCNDDGQSPLHCAARYSRDPKVIELLVQGGFDLKAHDLNGDSPLHIAAAFGNLITAEAMLQLGGDPNARGGGGTTLLHSIFWSGLNPLCEVQPSDTTQIRHMCEFLISSGSDVNATDDEGRTPLMIAAWTSADPSSLLALVRAYADPQLVDRSGNTALHYAAEHNPNPDVVSLLLRAGGGLESRNNFGRSPLHASIDNPSPSVVSRLLAAGAEIFAVDEEDLTPLELAETSLNEDDWWHETHISIEAHREARHRNTRVLRGAYIESEVQLPEPPEALPNPPGDTPAEPTQTDDPNLATPMHLFVQTACELLDAPETWEEFLQYPSRIFKPRLATRGVEYEFGIGLECPTCQPEHPTCRAVGEFPEGWPPSKRISAFGNSIRWLREDPDSRTLFLNDPEKAFANHGMRLVVRRADEAAEQEPLLPEQISRRQFDQLGLERNSLQAAMMEERAWFRSRVTTIAGFVGRDRTDDDYWAMLFGPDQDGKLGCIDCCANIESEAAASKSLAELFRKWEATGETVFSHD